MFKKTSNSPLWEFPFFGGAGSAAKGAESAKGINGFLPTDRPPPLNNRRIRLLAENTGGQAGRTILPAVIPACRRRESIIKKSPPEGR